MYLLYSLRSHGWLTKGSTYSTELASAKVVDRDEAIDTCRRFKSEGGHNLIPVRQEDLQEI